MKSVLFVMIISTFLSSTAKAEDNVACYDHSSQLDVSITDYNTLFVSHSRRLTLLRAEIKYAGETEYEVLVPEKTKLRRQSVQEIKLTYDNGTSIHQVFIVDWSQFDDGAEVPVNLYDLYPQSPEGELRLRTQILCSGAQS
jgi:hypothetical protein